MFRQTERTHGQTDRQTDRPLHARGRTCEKPRVRRPDWLYHRRQLRHLTLLLLANSSLLLNVFSVFSDHFSCSFFFILLFFSIFLVFHPYLTCLYRLQRQLECCCFFVTWYSHGTVKGNLCYLENDRWNVSSFVFTLIGIFLGGYIQVPLIILSLKPKLYHHSCLMTYINNPISYLSKCSGICQWIMSLRPSSKKKWKERQNTFSGSSP